jgi:hypothetical protein
MVPDVPAASPLRKGRCGQRGQAKGVVQLTIGEQTAVTGNPGTVELELDATVERDPERRWFGFTRRVRHPAPV